MSFIDKLLRRKPKYYELCIRVDRRKKKEDPTAYEVIETYDYPVSFDEIEDTLEPGQTYALFAVYPSGKKVLVWYRRKKKPRVEAPPHPRKLSFEEAVGVLADFAKQVGDGLAILKGVADSIYEALGMKPSGSTENLDEIKEAYKKQMQMVLDFQSELMKSVISSMGEATKNILFPYAIPGHWPTWAQMIAHPMFREGIKDMAKDIGEAVASGIKSGLRGTLFVPEQQPTTGVQPTSQTKSKKVSKIVEELLGGPYGGEE